MVRTAAVLVPLAVALAFVGCTRGPGSDVTISAEVKQELAKARLPETITVTTNSGVVTLAGAVPDATTKQRAEVVAAKVKDVHQVLNNLQTTTGAGDVPAPNVPSLPPPGMPGAPPPGMPNQSQNPAVGEPANPPPVQPPLNAPGPDRG